jgi:hypothetical protein
MGIEVMFRLDLSSLRINDRRGREPQRVKSLLRCCRQSAVTVELDLIDPIAGLPRLNKLRFHRLHKVRKRCRGQFHTEPRNADASTDQLGRSNLSANCLLRRWHLGIRWRAVSCACIAAKDSSEVLQYQLHAIQ